MKSLQFHRRGRYAGMIRVKQAGKDKCWSWRMRDAHLVLKLGICGRKADVIITDDKQ